MEHLGSDKVKCKGSGMNATTVSSNYDCQMRARAAEHSYFQYSATTGECELFETCEFQTAEEDWAVFADPMADFSVVGRTTLQLGLPAFLTSAAASGERLQQSEAQAEQYSCGTGRGGNRVEGCKATKISINNFVPRDLLLIEGGLPIGKSSDMHTCPLGWKIFSPTSERDWDAVGRSVSSDVLANTPVDVVSDEDSPAEAPRDADATKRWKTQDGSRWYLRKSTVTPPGRYQARCFIRVRSAASAANIEFSYSCRRTSTYLCQRQQVIPFDGASYQTLVQATDWLASAIMAVRDGLENDPMNLDGARLLVNGYIVPGGGRRYARRLAEGTIGVDARYDLEVEGANAANDLDQSLTAAASSNETGAALQASIASSPNMPNGTNITGTTVSEPEVAVTPPPPTPAPTPSPTLSPSASPTQAPTPSPTPHPTPPSRSHAPTASPTPAPTTSPTVVPTAAPTLEEETTPNLGAKGAPTLPPLHVAASGDPHLVNMRGQRFDLMVPGIHALLQIPRASHPEETLLKVEADAWALGGACADMYFQALNVTGHWVEDAARGRSGMQFSVSSPPAGGNTGWIALGKVDLKVVWGRTSQDIHYLNVFARHVMNTGYTVGGLLGEDDHTVQATPPSHCRHMIALSDLGEQQDASEGSTAEVM